MHTQRIVAVVLLVIGVALFVLGMNASNSVADQVSNTFTGRFTRETLWYLIGGGAAALCGLLMLMGGMRGKSA